MQINAPRQIVLRDDRTETYLREIQNSISSNVELVVVVFSTNRTDRYSAIKKYDNFFLSFYDLMISLFASLHI